MTQIERAQALRDLFKQRIVVLDGAMGTMIQQHKLDEAAYRGERFADWSRDLKGCNDLLAMTRPALIGDIHREFIEAGADIVSTNTFNATSVALADYGLESLVHELNRDAAQLARRVADEAAARLGRPVFVAGALGPTNRTASISPDVNDPGFRAVNFDDLVATYSEATRALVDGGVDAILIETIFDTLNAKAAIYAVRSTLDAAGVDLPIIISGTITDASGRTLSGQTVEAFWASVRHARPITISLNCALGVKQLRPYVEELSRLADTNVGVYPNAGLPNAFGEYDEAPADTASVLGDLAHHGHLNLVGGCCGTTPAHIRAIAERVRCEPVRRVKEHDSRLKLSGLEAFNLTEDIRFVNVGERTNVTGSAKFRKLIEANDYPQALSIARQQVTDGAQIIDVNMDEGMLDSEAAMVKFLNLIAAEPDISRVPVMIDSSKWTVIEAGLKCIQGKGVVNSISLKEGEKPFLEHARKCLNYGAAVVVMAFDEKGQADTIERKVSICERSYKLLVELGFPPEDIIFDPNIFAIATGIEEHNGYGLAFIEAAREIRKRCPHSHISGGVSNVSFSFRGNEPVRQAMHSVFLYHAIQAGMDFGIVNAGQLAIYEEIPKDLRERVEDVILNRRARCFGTTARDRHAVQGWPGQGKGRRPGLAQPAGERAAVACAGVGQRPVHHRGHRRSATRGRASAARHRRSAHGRHERGGRPVRLGQDVPAAGGQVRARHEEGRGAPDPVHRSAGRRRAEDQRHGGAGDRQGRRARHRQEHRRRRAPVQQLRDRRPGRHGARRQDPRDGREVGRRHDRPLRPHHAVARGDELYRRRDAAPRLQGAAADRRRHHVAGAHRGEDRSAVRRSRGVRQGRLACRGRVPAARHARDEARVRRGSEGGERAPPRAARRQEDQGRADDARPGAQQPLPNRLG